MEEASQQLPDQVDGASAVTFGRAVGGAVRELIDGTAGLQADDNLRATDQAWWENYRNQLERVAQEAIQG